MLKTMDTVVTSSDLSLERVLQAGLPVALIFHEGDLPHEWRKKMDELASRFTGKVLLVKMARQDSGQSAARYGVKSYPSLVTIKEGKDGMNLSAFTMDDLVRNVAYLAGEAPLPPKKAEFASAESQSHSEGPVAVTESDFDQRVLKSDQPVLIDFWAEWCGPCHMMDPALDRLARDQSLLKVVKVNVDENPNIASRYGVMGIPTMLVIEHGQEAERLVGALPEKLLRVRLARWTNPNV